MSNLVTKASPKGPEPKGPEAESEGQKDSPQPVSIGGLVLKKRTPGEASSSPMPTLRPRPAGGAPGVLRTGPSPNVQKRMERFSRVMPSRDPGVRMNENIRVPEVRVIDEDGQMVGVMSPKEAIEIARAKQQDLIEIVPNAKPPVCKIIEFGKWKYEQQKRDKQAKKSSHQQLLKEIRFHPRTDTHDFEFKVRHARAFIEEGHKVKAYVQFKGREVNYKQFGEELLSNFKARMEDIAKVDQDVSMMGRMMSMVLSPSGKKKAPSKKAEDRTDGEAKPQAKAKPSTKPEVDSTAEPEANGAEPEANGAEPPMPTENTEE